MSELDVLLGFFDEVESDKDSGMPEGKMENFIVAIDKGGELLIVKEPNDVAEWVQDDYNEWRRDTTYTEQPGLYWADYYTESGCCPRSGEYDYDSGFTNFRAIPLPEETSLDNVEPCNV